MRCTSIDTHFLGLSFRSTAKALDPSICGKEKSCFRMEMGTVIILHPLILLEKNQSCCLIIDKTMLQIGSDYTWLWVDIEPVPKQVLGVHVSRHRNMLVASIS
jgi:putative transposase